MEVEVRKPTKEELTKLDIKAWPIWEKQVCSFDWFYDEKETCLFLEGDVEVQCPDGIKVKIQKGDLVIFPQGLKCKWHIKKAVRKHYKFG
ncbi:MAG: cupin domain-containing protein [Candidatus Omnitrophota bacterium]|nr:cupin domain-containing protein [Candidatus Omnitrophota bacterium]